MPFWSPPYLLKIPNRQPLLICTRCHNQDKPAEMYIEFRSSMSTNGRYTLLRSSTVKIHGLDTNKRPQASFRGSKEHHEVLCKSLKAKKVILHTILLGVGGFIYTSHTLNHLKELGLDVHKAHKTALNLHAHPVLYAHKLTITRRALELSSCSQGLCLEQGAACHPPDPR